MTRPRLAMFAVFAATGLVSATWAARLPATADRLRLDVANIGVAVLGLEGGALVGLPAGAALVGSVGVRRSLRLAWLVFAGMLSALAVLPTLPAVVAGLAVWAAANSVADVAMNAAGVRLGSLSTLHAGHTLGLLAGGAVAAGAAASGMPLAVHFGAVALTAATVVMPSIRRMPEASRPSGPLLARPDRGLVLLGVVACCGFLVEGSAANWVAVHLRIEHGAGPAAAAAGYAAVMCALTLTRFTGDRLTGRFHRVRTVQTCGVLVAAGSAAAVLAPSAQVAVTGWVVAGAGVALVAPTVLAAAPSARRMPATTAIAAVTTLGYLGSFTGPPTIGALASATGLSNALALLTATGLVMVALARPALDG